MNIIKKGKCFAVTLLLGVGLTLTGCDLLGGDDDDEKPSIASFDVTGSANGVVISETQYNVTGVITADAGIKAIDIEVSDGVANPLVITAAAGYDGQTTWDLAANSQTLMIPASALAGGDVVVTITVTDKDDKTQEASVSLTLSDLIEFELQAGANQNATLGSSIDLDLGEVYLAAAARANLADIDICYAYSGTDGVEKLFTPAQAKASNFTFANGWGTPPDIKFHKTALTATEYEAITLVSEINALWVEASASTTSLAAAKGDVFIVQTSLGDYALVYIEDQVAGASGSISIKVAVTE